ncbi:MAG: hypothetical protein QME14_05940 [Methanobacteriaceae archaeon]|nr:hypothetical protein [Methanobacteriaceae archaeon]
MFDKLSNDKQNLQQQIKILSNEKIMFHEKLDDIEEALKEQERVNHLHDNSNKNTLPIDNGLNFKYSITLKFFNLRTLIIFTLSYFFEKLNKKNKSLYTFA